MESGGAAAKGEATTWKVRPAPRGLLKKVQMRGGAPPFELSGRRETRAELMPRARRTNHHLSPRLGAPPLSSNGHERAAEGAPTVFAK